MKITKTQLKEIIREEIEQLNEMDLATSLATFSILIATLVGIGSGAAIGIGTAKITSKYGSSVYNPREWKMIISDMWNKYKDNRKIKEIVSRLKGDPDLKPYLKDRTKRGIRKVLVNKLTKDELQYLNRITRTHLNK